MKLMRCVLVGGICGLVGAGIWGAIAHFANLEIGWIAWGIGLLVGLGVLKAANGENGLDTGAIAVVIALVSILAGKYLASHLAVSNAIGSISMAADPAKMSDEDFVSDIAEEVVSEYQEKKKRLAWPPGVTAESASEKKDYPKDVWTEAEKRWQAKSVDERNKIKVERKEQMEKLMGALGNHLRDEGFKSSFSPMDLLFFGLAVITAFKFGAGVQGD